MSFQGGMNAYNKHSTEPKKEIKEIWAEKDKLITEIMGRCKGEYYVTCCECGTKQAKKRVVTEGSFAFYTPDWLREVLAKFDSGEYTVKKAKIRK